MDGGCICGKVRYRLTSEPIIVNCCHCGDCQTLTGTAYAINAMIEADRVETLSGAPEPTMVPTPSGRGQQLWTCPDCHTTVWSNYGGTDDRLRFVRVGTLDDPAALPPDVHIYTPQQAAVGSASRGGESLRRLLQPEGRLVRRGARTLRGAVRLRFRPAALELHPMSMLLAPLMALSLVAAPVNFEARVLAAHNKVRAAAGVPPLSWNPDLANDAVAWGRMLAAEQRWQHDPTNRDEGENLWMGTAGGFTLEEMVGGWAGEGRDYRPGRFPNISRTGSWHDVGHYTQMIWRGTTEVGCGLVRGGGNDYLVCRYSPPGNVMGQPVD